jgi:hypothetical protein
LATADRIVAEVRVCVAELAPFIAESIRLRGELLSELDCYRRAAELKAKIIAVSQQGAKHDSSI